MKRYIGQILICVLPVLVSIIVVGWAYAKYMKGEGGFRLGVDLSGGTILVYEVDQSKMTWETLRTFKPGRPWPHSLKRRIDPSRLVQRHHPARARRSAAASRSSCHPAAAPRLWPARRNGKAY